VIQAGGGIEASFRRGKSEAGMDAYQVRTWEGWHHHMALTLMAVWFLVTRFSSFFVLDVVLNRVVAVSTDPAPDNAFALSFFGRPAGQLP
jgi:hypothetical protein